MNRGASTLREIYAQPANWAKCLNLLHELDLKDLIGDRNPQEFEWVFVGCGTSYYLADAAARSFTELTGRTARAVPASEILLFPSLVFPQAQQQFFPVLISRSGHTSEVLRVAEFMREREIEFLGVTCDGNELAGLTRRLLQLPVLEESTVMTSSFTSMLLALQYLGAWISGNESWLNGMEALPQELASLLSTYGVQVEDLAQLHFDVVAVLAQGGLYPIAQEASLKVMESSSTYAQFFHTLEFRHGPMSIVSDRTLVAGFLSENSLMAEVEVLSEMKGLGATIFAVGNRIPATLRADCDLAIELGLEVPELLRLVVYVVWGQLLGSYIGISKGLDPDNPINLSRVVTLMMD